MRHFRQQKLHSLRISLVFLGGHQGKLGDSLGKLGLLSWGAKPPQIQSPGGQGRSDLSWRLRAHCLKGDYGP